MQQTCNKTKNNQHIEQLVRQNSYHKKTNQKIFNYSTASTLYHDSEENLSNLHYENGYLNNLNNQNENNSIKNQSNGYDSLNHLSKEVIFYTHDDDNLFIKHESDDFDKKNDKNNVNFDVNKFIAINTLIENNLKTTQELQHQQQKVKILNNSNDSYNYLSNKQHQLNNKNNFNKTETNILKSAKFYQKFQPSLPKLDALLRSSSFPRISNNQKSLNNNSSLIIEKMRQNISETNRAAAISRRDSKNSIIDLSSLDSDSTSEEDENMQSEIKYNTKQVKLYNNNNNFV